MTILKTNLSRVIFTVALVMPGFKIISAQSKTQYIRIARLVIDSTKLDSYREALKLHAQTAIRLEPGILMLYAVYEKEHPTHVSVFEIYADTNAYKSHIQTPHFLKYKATVQNMVKSLELVDVSPIALEAKKQISNGDHTTTNEQDLQ